MVINPHIKKAPDERVVIIHECNQVETLKHLTENIKRLSEIITGNGNPDDGICRKVALIGERQKFMVEKVNEIHENIVFYHIEAVQAKEKAVEVERIIDRFMAESKGVNKGKDEASTKSQVNFTNIINILGTVLVVIGLVITVLIGKKERQIMDDKIDNLGTPVIVNSRGDIHNLTPGDSIKYFRDGEFKNFK